MIVISLEPELLKHLILFFIGDIKVLLEEPKAHFPCLIKTKRTGGCEFFRKTEKKI